MQLYSGTNARGVPVEEGAANEGVAVEGKRDIVPEGSETGGGVKIDSGPDEEEGPFPTGAEDLLDVWLGWPSGGIAVDCGSPVDKVSLEVCSGVDIEDSISPVGTEGEPDV